MGRSFEYYWNRGILIFFVLIVVPFVVAVYSTGSMEMKLSILAIVGPASLILGIAGACHLWIWLKGKGP